MSPTLTLVQRGIVSGANATADGVTLTVTQNAGTILFDNVLVSVAVQTATLVAADPTYNRYDMAGVDSAGVLHIVTGTPGDPPVYPDTLPATAYPYVYTGTFLVPAGATATGVAGTSDVTDTRSAPQNATAVRSGFVQVSQPADTLVYTFKSGALTNVDPGTGLFGFDSATIGSITRMFVNYMSASAPSGTRTWFQPGTAPGWQMPWIRIWSREDPTNWLMFSQTSFTNHTTYGEVGLTLVAASTSTTGVTLTTDPQDTVIEYAGPPPGFVPIGPVKIFDAVLASPVTTISITPIATLIANAGGVAANLHNLQLELFAAGTQAANELQVLCQLNGDSGAHYDATCWYIAGSTTTSIVNAATQTAAVIGAIPGTSAPAGSSGVITCKILGFDSTALWKMIQGTFADHTNSVATGFHAGMSSNQWQSTAAVTSMLLSLNAGQFATGTRCCLYAL
jgi:hypothetical protein